MDGQPLATPDDCLQAEAIARQDPQVGLWCVAPKHAVLLAALLCCGLTLCVMMMVPDSKGYWHCLTEACQGRPEALGSL
jgi:hypothetical protein